jgi:uncharacterized protein YfaS (alpha-2-macroglobulin family)
MALRPGGVDRFSLPDREVNTMRPKSRLAAVGAALAAGFVCWLAAAEAPPFAQRQAALMKTLQQGNFKDAYDGLRKLALDPQADPRQVGRVLEAGIQCLQRLGRIDEIDEFREAVVAVHAKNWRLLDTAAQSYVGPDQQHFGYIIAGKFYRGPHRGGGRVVSTWERDRGRALQLMQQAHSLTRRETDKPALAGFYLHFAQVLLQGAGVHDAWRLQYLTDLKELPDYTEGYYWPYNQGRGAPVDADGNPVFHRLPKSYEAATSDGERWRWMLAQAVEYNPARQGEVETMFADFLRQQFDVQTMAAFGQAFRQDDAGAQKTGTFALHTLKDDETIARLASGVKRFPLPEEFNWIHIYQRIAARGRSAEGQHARDTLAQVYEDRRQYVKAAQAWQKAIAEYGKGNQDYRQKRLDQIVGSWGRFEPGQVQPAGQNAVADFRFRNGTRVSFEAYAIDVPRLLADLKRYLTGHTGQLDWQQMNIGDIGYRLVERQERQYLGARLAAWDLELKPRPDHVDDRITIQTPLRQPGAYLLRARMAGGNLSRLIVWVSDTVIVRKQLDGQVLYCVADAVTGRPVVGANVEFFGFKQVQVAPNTNNWRVDTITFRETTNDDGQVVLGPGRLPQDHQWLLTATARGGNDGGRFAYLGFTGAWFGRVYDPEYNQVKVFTLTDRPVYRPAHTVHFKAWVRHARYDQADTSDFADKSFTVRIFNPKGEKIYEKDLKADAYGGIGDDLPLSKDVALGVYHIQIQHPGVGGGGSFRVEEYKKPEFEVQVEAPRGPVRLGEKVEATIKASYYFGAPVTSAKVKYKVLRTAYTERWYPRGSWDWMYGRGYWWFAADYDWYPGFGDWGCRRPVPIWWHTPSGPPEVVLENETAIGPDGTVKVVIDTRAAQEMHGDQDHQYAITAEVVDESRRTIVGTGNVLVSRKPFQVFSWVDRGHYRVGDTVRASFQAQTLDQKPVQGTGELTLYKISYDDDKRPVEKAVETWKLDTGAEGHARQQLKAAQPGQFRLSYKLTDSKQHTIEGGYLFVVQGEGFDGSGYRFNDVELVTDRREYNPGDKVKLLINTNRQDAVVLLFVRPTNSVYLPPQVLRLRGKSVEQEIAVVQKDMPNFFIEALTVAGGRVHTEVREVIVPPERRVLDVAVTPSQSEYKPGQPATVKIKLTDLHGKPFVGSTVLTMYDKSVEYISGGSNVPEIKEFFWKWRRHHHPQTESSLARWLPNLVRSSEIAMSNLGVFGETVVEELRSRRLILSEAATDKRKDGAARGLAMPTAPPAAPAGFGGGGDAPRQNAMPAADLDAAEAKRDGKAREEQAAGPGGGPEPAPVTVRKNFADTAFWAASLTTNQDGMAEVSLKMPENLTGWKIRVWAMGHGTKVGQGEAEVTTKKDLLLRLQAPRFFTQTDEVVLSANVHNYKKVEKAVTVALELEGGTLKTLDEPGRKVTIPAGGEHRVDWRVRVTAEGEAVVRMKALSDDESDAMEMRFPCQVHGILKTDSYAGALRPEQNAARLTLTVPTDRRVADSRLEVRYSPTLAGAMVDALPYLVDYPYGCTEQTLNRFLPTVITQRILMKMNLDLKAIEQKRANLNAQEVGDPAERAKQWKRFDRNPVFDEATVKDMTHKGIAALAAMQLSDGGWGWFSGFGEHSWPHTTAVVVHGLQIARDNDVLLPPGMLENGINWLKAYQAQQIQMLKNAPGKVHPYKEHADEVDALVYMVLVDAGANNDEMRSFLYRDRTHLAVYAKAMFGLALHRQGGGEQLAMIQKNIEQFVVQDEENQTAYLKLPEGSPWWYWYGSEVESNGYYLKLLAKTSPKDQKASRLVKYLLNNRKHATYWNSTRDTAVCIEAMADYLKASGEDKPDLTLEVWLDDKKQKEVHIDAGNLFSYDDRLVLTGAAVEGGKHALEIRKKGTGPLYFNAYLTNFTTEDFITRAGLEVKVQRKYYRLTPVDQKVKVPGARGQALDQKVEKYKRTELESGVRLKSGDLVEVELEIDSKNDYEYLLFEDPKAAGFEALAVRSGYNGNDMGAYMEVRDARVCFFVRQLARGKHSVAYRLRAEIPGSFSALPTQASAMYAPELRGNSDEIKLQIVD